MSPPKGVYFLARGDLVLFKLQEAGTRDLHYLNCSNLVLAAEAIDFKNTEICEFVFNFYLFSNSILSAIKSYRNCFKKPYERKKTQGDSYIHSYRLEFSYISYFLYFFSFSCYIRNMFPV